MAIVEGFISGLLRGRLLAGLVLLIRGPLQVFCRLRHGVNAEFGVNPEVWS